MYIYYQFINKNITRKFIHNAIQYLINTLNLDGKMKASVSQAAL